MVNEPRRRGILAPQVQRDHPVTSKYSVELFMEACNAPGPLQLSVLDATRPEPLRRVFHQPFVVIGRNPTTDLLLDHWRVSRRHAYLQIVMGRLFCIDLGSRTGTEWDDGTKAPGWLDPDRSIVVGPYEISLWDDRVGDAWPGPGHQTRALDEAEDLTDCTITFEDQTGRHTPVSLGRGLTLVGTAPECRVRLPFPDVSKTHCSLIRSANGVWVVDLLGRGGTFVNETHVRFARLDDGDDLKIGRHILRFQMTESSNPTIAAPSPGRAIARRSHDNSVVKIARTPSSPAPPPSSTMPMVSTWRYPEHELHRTLGDRQIGQAELVQALMQPMVQQFSLMQQQMFEQFHQAMMGMFQTFGAAHREQMSELREEIDEVRRITQELQSLQTEVAGAASPNPPASGPASVVTPPRVAPPSPASSAPATQVPISDESPIRRPTTTTNVAVHGVLFERISALQNERQSRWQKILARLNRSS
jgi:pSer/pThr/pTyr-binding forkhead associated (FHA) protein